MGIAGSSRVSDKNRAVKKNEVAAQNTCDDAPQNPFKEASDDDQSQHANIEETTADDEVDMNLTAASEKQSNADVKFV
jgi:hypothetical protein